MSLYYGFSKRNYGGVLPAIAERMGAFLDVLPKNNYALLQALEPVFEYLLYEQEILSDERKRKILMIEKLLEKTSLEKHELLAGENIMKKHPHLLSYDCRKMLCKHQKENETVICQWLVRMWFDYHDRKNLKYSIFLSSPYYHVSISTNTIYENFNQMANAIQLRMEKFKTLNLKVDYKRSRIFPQDEY